MEDQSNSNHDNNLPHDESTTTEEAVGYEAPELNKHTVLRDITANVSEVPMKEP